MSARPPPAFSLAFTAAISAASAVSCSALDHGAEQRFLGFEMMVQRLPRQPGGFGRLLDRGTPETVPAEDGHGGIENAVARLHLSILTKQKEVSNNEAVWADAAVGSAAHACQITSAAALDRAGYKLREGFEAWPAAGHRGSSRRNRSRSANRSRRPCAPGLSSIANTAACSALIEKVPAAAL